jgi:hypothetical protein
MNVVDIIMKNFNQVVNTLTKVICESTSMVQHRCKEFYLNSKLTKNLRK